MDVLQRFLPATTPTNPPLLDRRPTPVPPNIESIASPQSREGFSEDAERDENATSLDVFLESKPSSPAVVPPTIVVIEDSDANNNSSSSDTGILDYRVDEADASDRTIRHHNRRTLVPRTLPRDVPRRKAGRQRLRRSSSNSGVEAISKYKQKADEVKTLVEQVHELRVSPSGTPPHRPWKLRRVSTAPGLREKHMTDGNKHGEPRFIWIPSTSSTADTSCHTTNVTPSEKGIRDDCSTPLRAYLERPSDSRTSSPSRMLYKPNLKKKAIGSPPSGLTCNETIPGHRRTKAVDFDSPTSLFTSSVTKLKTWIAEKDRTVTTDSGIEIAEARTVSFMKPRSKSKAADSAVTRTDVHVVAISAPDGDATPRKRSATPTKQIVQTGTGGYGVVWDDAPNSSPDNESHRRGSSAGQALEAAGSTSLERVDTKLSDWSWRNVNPFEKAARRDRKPSQFVPNIVVFPDDSYEDTVSTVASGRHIYPRTTNSSTLDSSEDTDAFVAPPNSLQSSSFLLPRHDPPPPPNSASSSGGLLPRRSPLAGRNSESRATDTTDTSATSLSSSSASSALHGAVLPPPPSPSTTDIPSCASDRPRMKKDSLFPSASDEHLHITTTHRLSHIDNLHFRTHKDSLAVARARWERKYSNAMGMVGRGGVDPERFARRCSVAIARKRMKGRREKGKGRLESLSEGGGEVGLARVGEVGRGRVIRIVE
ncbi:hypothetical protein BU16DRAFT_555992 [Lophium mytilinum]|uniref:Uncharacterized protein n=1 Tax=Lophium mytilinum TaxID=390894 RepID=A0A6A6RA15_9PEZI|nr:hypothetical protein BU16DRAFT_555992 [Lophium mytilinum]